MQVLEKDRPQTVDAWLLELKGNADPEVTPTVLDQPIPSGDEDVAPTTQRRIRWLWTTVTVSILGGIGYAVSPYFFEHEVTKIPAVTGTAILQVTSKPPGAKVFLDDKMVGVTTYQDNEVPAGSHQLRLEKRYFAPVDDTFKLDAEMVVKRSFVLKPGQGNITILSTPSDADVFLDGKKRPDKTPMSLSAVPSG